MMLLVYSGNGNSIPSVDTVSGSLPVEGRSPGSGCVLGVVRGAASRLVLSATGGADHRHHLNHVGVWNSSIGTKVRPRGSFRSHERGKRSAEVLVGEGRLFHIYVAIAVERHDQTRLGLEGPRLGTGQADIDAT